MNWQKLDKVTIFTGTDENGNRYLSQFLRDYKEAFPGTDPNAGCQRCLDDYYQKLIKHLSIMKTVKNESGFVLKEKYQNIPLKFGSKILVNNSNITKEIGIELLKRKNGEKLFDKVPDNLEATSDKEDLTKLKRGELNTRATKLGLDAKSYANIGEIAAAIEKAESTEVKETAGEGTEEVESSDTSKETETESTGQTAGEGTE
ncbi:hypothetical protein [Xanthomarina gelatinilytica]|uniref:hypothetical protein n=1 Tax=Xanthomarina gelatinilytica TaxID=1137281 RepID=UPI003AA85F36